MNENKHIPLLRDGAHGQRFWEEHVDFFSSVLLPIKGHVPQDVFRKATEELRMGAEAGEAACAYLYAEFLFWHPGFCEPDIELGDDCFDEDASEEKSPFEGTVRGLRIDSWQNPSQWLEIWTEDQYCEFIDSKQPYSCCEEALAMYVHAAELGSPLAACWLAWCYTEGIGCTLNREKADRYLSMAKSFGPLDSLNADGAREIKREIDCLDEQCDSADIDESIYYDQLSQGSSDGYLPDPDPYVIHSAIVALGQYGCCLGYVDMAQEISYDEGWPDSFAAESRRLRLIKERWAHWCEQQGLLVKSEKDTQPDGTFENLIWKKSSWEHMLSIAITGAIGKIRGRLEIPEEIEGIRVRIIDWDAFAGQDEMTSVLYHGPCIRPGAFRGCKNLELAEIDCSRTDIRRGAFENCPNLKTVYLADYEYIDEYAIGYEKSEDGTYRRYESAPKFYHTAWGKITYAEENGMEAERLRRKTDWPPIRNKLLEEIDRRKAPVTLREKAAELSRKGLKKR